MDSVFIIEKSVIIVAVFALTMLMAMYSTWAERKVAAFLQDRVGPNRAGWGGLLQPLADGAKLFTKEEFFPNTPNKFLFIFDRALYAIKYGEAIKWVILTIINIENVRYIKVFLNAIMYASPNTIPGTAKVIVIRMCKTLLVLLVIMDG